MADEINSKNKRMSMSVSLSQDEVKMLEWLAAKQRITLKEAIRKVIGLETYLYKERKAGSKILFRTKNGEVREVIFR